MMYERNREGAEKLLKLLEEQEKTLVFDKFTNADALKLGVKAPEIPEEINPKWIN